MWSGYARLVFPPQALSSVYLWREEVWSGYARLVFPPQALSSMCLWREEVWSVRGGGVVCEGRRCGL